MIRNLLMTFIFTCAVSFISNAQKIVKGGLQLHLGYSRDISKQPNMKIGFAFNERQAGSGLEKGFNGIAISAMADITEMISLKIEATNHFSSGHIQTGIVYETGTSGNITIAGGSTKYRRSSFLAGLQAKKEITGTRFIPFAHLMVGAHQQSMKIKVKSGDPDDIKATKSLFGGDKVTSTGFATGLGAGLDIKVNEKINIRAIQLNYNINFIGNKNLSKESPSYSSSQATVYKVELQEQKQKQVTIGFGVVYRL